MSIRGTALVFDVNETLLDLSSLRPPIERTLGDASLLGMWFGQMLELSFTGIATGIYLDFPSAQRAALRMLARRLERRLAEADVEAVVEAMNHLSPHPDVPSGLRLLKEAGVRLASLTNSPLAVARAQLANAGIVSLFQEVLSADEVRRLKPAPEPYLLAADRLGVQPSAMTLVAAHAWDVSGALAAGCHAVFLARPGRVPSPAGTQPDLVVSNLIELAARLSEP